MKRQQYWGEYVLLGRSVKIRMCNLYRSSKTVCVLGTPFPHRVIYTQPDGEICKAFVEHQIVESFGESGTNHVDPNSLCGTVANQMDRWEDLGPNKPELWRSILFGASQDPVYCIKTAQFLVTVMCWAFSLDQCHILPNYKAHPI